MSEAGLVADWRAIKEDEDQCGQGKLGGSHICLYKYFLVRKYPALRTEG